MSLRLLPGRLAICRLPADSPPACPPETRLWSLTRAGGELSLVCAEDAVPPGADSNEGWRAFEVEGPLDLAMTGVLASIAVPLAEAGLSLFAVSTHDTDYVLVKEADLAAAGRALRSAGHRLAD